MVVMAKKPIIDSFMMLCIVYYCVNVRNSEQNDLSSSTIIYRYLQ